MSNINNPVQVFTKRMPIYNRNIVINYPFVEGITNPVVQHRINRVIINMVNSLISDQMAQLTEGQGIHNPKVTMNGWYEIKTNQRGILSLILSNYTMPFKAAHGLTLLRSLTFDIHNGKVYGLNEMFKPNSNYVEVLSQIVRRQIKERDFPTFEEFKKIDPNQYYYIADKCLVLYFQLYDLTAYAYGFPFFPISVYEIQDIIKEDSPLGLMLANS